MEEIKLFVLAITHIGPWLGMATKSEHENWKNKNCALHMEAPRGLQIIQMDEAGSKFGVQIGSPYMTDTYQNELDLHPIAVEVLGEVINAGQECTDHKQLWGNYNDALTKWRAAKSNITIAGPGAMSNLKPMPTK